MVWRQIINDLLTAGHQDGPGDQHGPYDAPLAWYVLQEERILYYSVSDLLTRPSLYSYFNIVKGQKI